MEGRGHPKGRAGSEPLAVVLVHGAFHGAWCWERVVPLLEERGLVVRTVDLPSVSIGDGTQTGRDDAAAVVEVLDDLGAPALLCGHSYGGIPISNAAEGRDDVARLVYLAAAMLEVGETPMGLFERAGVDASWVVIDGDCCRVDPARAAEAFYGDCDPETQRAAIARVRPMSLPAASEPAWASAWRSIPSTYVVCALDGAMPPHMQREIFVPRADEVVELETSHSPFYSQPAAVAELLAERALRPAS